MRFGVRVAHLNGISNGTRRGFEDSHMTAAASISSAMVVGLLTPLSLDQKAGKSTLPCRPSAKVPTPTPSVSRYSIVRGMSRKLLQPLEITVTGVLPSYVKSAEISMLDSAPR